jgi:hypothetical protein
MEPNEGRFILHSEAEQQAATGKVIYRSLQWVCFIGFEFLFLEFTVAALRHLKEISS